MRSQPIFHHTTSRGAFHGVLLCAVMACSQGNSASSSEATEPPKVEKTPADSDRAEGDGTEVSGAVTNGDSETENAGGVLGPRPMRVYPNDPETGAADEGDGPGTTLTLFQTVETYPDPDRDYQYVIEAVISYTPGEVDRDLKTGEPFGLPVTIELINHVFLDRRTNRPLVGDKLYIPNDCAPDGLCGYNGEFAQYVAWGHVLLAARENCNFPGTESYVVVDHTLAIEDNTIYGFWGEEYGWDEITAAADAAVAAYGPAEARPSACPAIEGVDDAADGVSDESLPPAK